MAREVQAGPPNVAEEHPLRLIGIAFLDRVGESPGSP
jgi:hypothetical protein